MKKGNPSRAALFYKNCIMKEETILKNVLLDGKGVDIEISGGTISGIVPSQCKNKPVVAILPSFYNTHTHAAMIQMRGYGDDMDLHTWLNDWIWPFEAKMTADDIENASYDAVQEMISTGTTAFNDMYFEIERTVKAVKKYGIRSTLGITVMENHTLAQTQAKQEFVRNWNDPTGGLIQLIIAPHAIYTVGEERLVDCARFAREHGLKLHIHLSETQAEVNDCLKLKGLTPVKYLDKIGFLGPDVIAAHCVHINKEEWDILAERGVSVSHCPCSNMKLGSGRFPYELALASGVNITLGTDGVSSNNNLDMREEMKFASYLAKCVSASEDGSLKNEGNPELLPAKEIFRMATVNGAKALGINGGEIAVGKVADFVLLDLDNIAMKPCHNLISNWVYAAQKDTIKEVWCNGRTVYKNN